MPRRDDIHTILILGSGPIVIGQAAEFDYSGVQACKVLREEGYRVVLVNSNPATIMTDPEFADATYVEPLLPGPLAKIIERERPDALLPTLGGQTALNLAKALHDDGTLERFGVELIGANYDAIACAEDRELFGAAMAKAGLSMPASAIVSARLEEPGTVAAGVPGAGEVNVAVGVDRAMQELPKVGLPCIVRPAFTLGGRGGGIARDEAEFETDRRAGPGGKPDRPGPARPVGARLGRVRAGGDARQSRQRRDRLLDREHRPDGRPHRRLGAQSPPSKRSPTASTSSCATRRSP